MDRPIAMEPRMKRHLALLLLLMVAAPPVSADQDNVRCLRSIGVQPLLRIQFGLGSDSDRPSEFETQWLELTGPASAGRYVYTSEGALIDDFRYIRKDGRIFKFVDDADALDVGRCTWAPS